MEEPDWARFVYTSGGYSGECEFCGEVVELQFGDGEKGLLTFKHKDDDFDQDELHAFVLYFTFLKLDRACDCEREPQSQDLSMWKA